MKFLDFMLTIGAVVAFAFAAYLFASDPGLAQTEEAIVDQKIAETTAGLKGQVSKQVSANKASFTPKPQAVNQLAPVKDDQKAVSANVQWKYIIIHHSATKNGSAKIFDRYHREEKGLAEGLAYHFVIGNGTNSKDGQVETGARWDKQIPGVHCWDGKMNQQSIGICLVGDFDQKNPTEKQVSALLKLLKELCQKYNIPSGNIVVHRDVDKGETNCPGKNFSLDTVKTRLIH
ncbi:MAG: peptidoglycan recognition family protein [Candidatus Brocadiia bacterium]